MPHLADEGVVLEVLQRRFKGGRHCPDVVEQATRLGDQRDGFQRDRCRDWTAAGREAVGKLVEFLRRPVQPAIHLRRKQHRRHRLVAGSERLRGHHDVGVKS